jgi:hypothetical protein
MVKRFSLKPDKRWWYFLDPDGDVSRRPPIQRRGQVAEKVMKLGIQRNPGFYYELEQDDEGPGVFRVPIVGGATDHT